MKLKNYIKEYIKEDIYRFFSEEEKEKGISTLSIIRLILSREELWAIINYRVGRWIILTIRYKWIRKPLLLFWAINERIIRVLSGNIIIYLNADIGKGLYLHYGPIYIGPTKIGEYCNFAMMSLIGFGGRDERWGIPVIGDRVFFGPGAIATGKIKIGNNVAVGANSVVNIDLPDNCTAAGVPVRILNYRGSDQLITIRKE